MKPQNRFDESVAFENPGYSRPEDRSGKGLSSGKNTDQPAAAATEASSATKLPLPLESEPAVMSGQDATESDPYSNLQPSTRPDASVGMYATIDHGDGDKGIDSGSVNINFKSSQS